VWHCEPGLPRSSTLLARDLVSTIWGNGWKWPGCPGEVAPVQIRRAGRSRCSSAVSACFLLTSTLKHAESQKTRRKSRTYAAGGTHSCTICAGATTARFDHTTWSAAGAKHMRAAGIIAAGTAPSQEAPPPSDYSVQQEGSGATG
jgi:hypothetical protein